MLPRAEGRMVMQCGRGSICEVIPPPPRSSASNRWRDRADIAGCGWLSDRPRVPGCKGREGGDPADSRAGEGGTQSPRVTSIRLGKNYGKRSTAEHESAAQGRVDKPNNLT
jgi:hypothetical protein